MAWAFPTSTCESIQPTMPHQPWSALVNAAIMAMLLMRKRTAVVYSILLFEALHLYGHVALADDISLVQHLSIYPIMYSYLRPPKGMHKFIALDMAIALAVGGIWQIFSGMVVFLLCKPPDARVTWGSVAVILLLWNEYMHCEKMVAWFDFPYHVLLELSGMYIFHRMTLTGPTRCEGRSRNSAPGRAAAGDRG